MFFDAFRAEGLKAFGFDTIIEADLIGMVSTGIRQGFDIDHGSVLDLGN